MVSEATRQIVVPKCSWMYIPVKSSLKNIAFEHIDIYVFGNVTTVVVIITMTPFYWMCTHIYVRISGCIMHVMSKPAPGSWNINCMLFLRRVNMVSDNYMSHCNHSDCGQLYINADLVRLIKIPLKLVYCTTLFKMVDNNSRNLAFRVLVY